MTKLQPSLPATDSIRNNVSNQIHRNVVRVAGMVFLLLIPAPALAGHSDDLLSMPLEELLKVEFYTASQELEKAASSPAITSVITAKQLKQWGVNNLYEALSFLPGVTLNESYVGYSVLTFRGVTPGLYNNKALFLINGQPVYERMFGSSHLEYVPLEMIERVEVVRSPASVLYGSNAVSGVVNVITKQSGNLISLKAGSNEYYSGAVTYNKDNFSMSASGLRDDGYSYGGTDDELGNPVDFDYNNSLDNIFIDYRPKGWRINAAYFELEKAKFGLNPIVLHHGDNRHDAFHFTINRYQPLGKGTFNAWLRYDRMDLEFDAESFPPRNNPVTSQSEVERIAAEIQYKQSLSKETSYIVGASYEEDSSDPLVFIDSTDGSTTPLSPITENQSFHNSAMYAQFKHHFSNKVNTIVGLRVEDNSDTGGSGLIPRLGMTYEFIPDNYLKILYGEAFRAPVFLEKYARIDGILFGDRKLDSEKIKTLEVGISSKLNNSNQLDITAYWLDLSDEITRRPATGGGTEYFNSSGREMYGLESQWVSVLSTKASLNINASYMDGEEDVFGSAPFIANYTMNIMFNYQLNAELDFSISNQYVGSKDYILTDNTEGDIGAYNLTNLVFNYHKKDYELALTFRNIFDEDYTFPEPVRRNISEIPGGPGSTAYINLIIHY